MDNTELNVQSIKENLKFQMQEAEINLKTFESLEELQNTISILKGCLADLEGKKGLDEIKEAMNSTLKQYQAVLNNYELGLLELEREVNNRPD